MKTKERDEAIRLRKEDGVSVREIAKRLGVSKGSVSRWVRGIILTEEQLIRLDRSMDDGSYQGRVKGAETNRRVAEDKHTEWQKQGREDAKKKHWLHVAGCMLYWAEGHKRNNKTAVCFSNSELPMVQLFLRFIREWFGVTDDRIQMSVNCYTDIRSLDEIEKFWLDGLGLSRSCLRKSIVDRRPACTQRKVNGTLPYGTCKMVIGDVSIIQKIYGAIQEYGGFEKREW